MRFDYSIIYNLPHIFLRDTNLVGHPVIEYYWINKSFPSHDYTEEKNKVKFIRKWNK
jgi:hypothetical protein